MSAQDSDSKSSSSSSGSGHDEISLMSSDLPPRLVACSPIFKLEKMTIRPENQKDADESAKSPSKRKSKQKFKQKQKLMVEINLGPAVNKALDKKKRGGAKATKPKIPRKRRKVLLNISAAKE